MASPFWVAQNSVRLSALQQGSRLRIVTRRRGSGWEWLLQDFFGCEIDSAKAPLPKTRDEAHAQATKRKERYLKHLKIWRMRLELVRKEKNVPEPLTMKELMAKEKEDEFKLSQAKRGAQREHHRKRNYVKYRQLRIEQLLERGVDETDARIVKCKIEIAQCNEKAIGTLKAKILRNDSFCRLMSSK